MVYLPLRNGNPAGMFTAGDEMSSPTGTTLSPLSVPNGRNMSGTDGSVRLSTVTASNETISDNSRIDLMSVLRTHKPLEQLKLSVRVQDCVKLVVMLTLYSRWPSRDQKPGPIPEKPLRLVCLISRAECSLIETALKGPGTNSEAGRFISVKTARDEGQCSLTRRAQVALALSTVYIV